MIREATQADIPALLLIGEKFAARAQLAEHVGYDSDSLATTLGHMIASDDGIVLVTDDGSGAAGGFLHPHPFNLNVRVGQELFWWSEAGHGGALFDALETEARAKGAKYWSMITLEAIRPEATGKLYQRRGYRPLEHSYIKEL